MYRLALVILSVASALIAGPVGFIQTNLASDVPGLAQFTDPDLVNAWGMAASSASPVWIGANGSGLSVLYNGAGVKQALVVTMAGDKSVTGVAFSNVPGFFNGDTFLFANEDGTIGGWRGALGTTAETCSWPALPTFTKGSDRCDHRRQCVRIRRELPQRHDRRTERKCRSAELDRELYGSQSALGICAVRHRKSRWCYCT